MRQQARTAFRFLPPAVAAALTFSLVVWLTEQGPGLSPDSAYYLSAAENLLSGSGLTTFEGRPLTTWPPLFPVLIAGLGSVGVSPAEAARVINAAAAGLAVLVFGLLADRLLRRPELRLLALVGIISVPLLSVALMAWTEAVFVLLCLLFVLLFARWLDTGKTLVLAAAASCTALPALQRWAGLALIPAGILLVLTAAGPVSRLRRAGLALLFAVIGLGPPAAWMVRNLAVAGTLAGRRPFTSGSLPAALRELGTVVGEYLLPDFLLTDWSWLPVLAVVALFVFWRLRRTWQAPGPAAHFERVLGLTTAAYVAGVALVLTPHALEQVARLLVPAWPLLLLLMLAALQQVAEDIGRRVGRPTVIRALAALLA
ncbi:MAG: hypothetical protein JSU73_08675, partial [candidate division WOR-3 bacterium]